MTDSQQHDRDEIIEQLDFVRRHGGANMLHRSAVERVAYDNDLFALVNFIETSTMGEYIEALDEMGERAAKR